MNAQLTKVSAQFRGEYPQLVDVERGQCEHSKSASNASVKQTSEFGFANQCSFKKSYIFYL